MATLKGAPGSSGIVRCAACGAGNATNARACGQCAARIPPAPAAHAMAEPTSGALVPHATAYVALSSVLGLGAYLVPVGVVPAAQFILAVWGSSLLADLVFVAGTLAVGWVALTLSRRSLALSIIFAFLASWAVYSVSWMLVPPAVLGASELNRVEDVVESFRFTIGVGGAGLAFAAVAPAAVVGLRRARVAWRGRVRGSGAP